MHNMSEASHNESEILRLKLTQDIRPLFTTHTQQLSLSSFSPKQVCWAPNFKNHEV